NSAYYYYDEVSVVALCTNVPVKNVACGSPLNFDPAPIGVDRCAGSNVTVTLFGNVTNTVCPLSVSRVWTLTDLCGNATNWSQTINVTNSGAFSVNCACLQDSMLGQLTTNACPAVIPLITIPSNSPCIVNSCGPLAVSQSPAPGTPVGAGITNITVKLSNCSGVTNTCILPFYVNPSPPIVICPKDITLFTCGGSAAAFYAPQVSGNTGTIVCSPPSGSLFPLNTSTLVTCTVTNGCGGSATCT